MFYPHILKTKRIVVLALFFIGILPAFGEPILTDPDFVVKKLVSDISGSPTTMAFVGDDILVLQKEDGKVRLIKDGMLQEKPVLDVEVNSSGERGLLGITTVGSTVYLYFTESTHDGSEPLGNRIYRYDWNGQELVNQILVKKLPSTNNYHNGGAMVTGLDGSVYAVIGDTGTYGVLQNHPSGGINDTSVILRVVPEGPYYAMGIRNSFGLAIDPVNGNLWATENGPDDFDEINLVAPNFNSGWDVIMGPATEPELSMLPGYDGYAYSDPEFSWEQVVAPTALSFVDSNKFEKYKNSLFVADCILGNLYKFELNSNRDGFIFDDPALADKVVNRNETMQEIGFGTGFGCITDLEVGPDGFLYVVSLSEGTIYRIMPKTDMINKPEITKNSEESLRFAEYLIIAALIAVALIVLKVRKKNVTPSQTKITE